MMTIALGLWVLWASAVLQQSATIETPHLTITAVPAGEVSAGAPLTLYADVVPKPKMHVYAPSQKGYIPVSLTLDEVPGFRWHAAVYPKPEKYFFAPLNETQLVYTKGFRIKLRGTLKSAASLRDAGHRPGSVVVITGTLRYQACDDAICYMPRDVPVSWSVTLANGAMQ